MCITRHHHFATTRNFLNDRQPRSCRSALVEDTVAKLDIPKTRRLADWADWWIEAHCDCGRQYHPCLVLAVRLGPDAELCDLAPQFACKDCTGQPSITMVSAPGSLGRTAGWRTSEVQRIAIRKS